MRPPPQSGTVGLLYGIARWGCENGYSFRYLCGGPETGYFYLEKEVDADYGYVVVFHVVQSAEGWNVFALDSTTPVTVKRTDAGDVKLSVVLSLRQKSSATGAPVGYTETLRNEYRGQATSLKIDILAYCSAVQEGLLPGAHLAGRAVDSFRPRRERHSCGSAVHRRCRAPAPLGNPAARALH